MRILLPIALPCFLCCAGTLAANPLPPKSGATLYLQDAESYVGKAAVIPQIHSEEKSSPSPTPRATPCSTPVLTSSKEESDEVDPVASGREYPAAVIHRSNLQVGQQIPVPTRYAAPQVIATQNGGVTVVPATPTSFRTIQTGTTMRSDASGATVVHDTQLNGLVN